MILSLFRDNTLLVVTLITKVTLLNRVLWLQNLLELSIYGMYLRAEQGAVTG